GAGNMAPLLAMALFGMWRLLRRRAVQRRALALARNAVLAVVIAGSSTARAQTMTVQPQFNADRFDPGAGGYDILAVGSASLPVRLAASSGIVLRRARDFANLTVGNALTFGVAGELPFSFAGQRLAALATLAGEVELQQSGAVERPMELLAGLRWLLPANLQF